MRILAAMLFLVWTAAGEIIPKPPRPPCSKQAAGQFWPAEANSDSNLARKLSREGTLEICTRTAWSYRWISPTVNVKFLRKAALK